MGISENNVSLLMFPFPKNRGISVSFLPGGYYFRQTDPRQFGPGAFTSSSILLFKISLFFASCWLVGLQVKSFVSPPSHAVAGSWEPCPQEGALWFSKSHTDKQELVTA